jgi:HAD superfamily hydrolase (TIGR01509 family)
MICHMRVPGMAVTVRTALFDIDGTLLESNDAHAHAWIDAFTEAGFGIPLERVRPLIGMGADQLIPAVKLGLSADANPGKNIAARRAQIFKRSYLRDLQPTRGARALVLLLRERGVTCVAATSAKQDELDDLLARADVADLFQLRSTSDDADTSKPAPDIVQAALAKANALPGETVLIGDTRYDIEAAARAGVTAIALRCGGSNDLRLAGAAAIYDDPAALSEAIRIS